MDSTAYWVVRSSACPGIYRSLFDAVETMNNLVNTHIERCDDYDTASHVWRQRISDNEVVAISAAANMCAERPYVLQWFVVIRRYIPGVYSDASVMANMNSGAHGLDYLRFPSREEAVKAWGRALALVPSRSHLAGCYPHPMP